MYTQYCRAEAEQTLVLQFSVTTTNTSTGTTTTTTQLLWYYYYHYYDLYYISHYQYYSTFTTAETLLLSELNLKVFVFVKTLVLKIVVKMR